MKKRQTPKLRCSKCKKGTLRQHVNVFVECSLANTNLSKKGIRDKDVSIWGAGWPTATVFCTNSKCGYLFRGKG